MLSDIGKVFSNRYVLSPFKSSSRSFVDFSRGDLYSYILKGKELNQDLTDCFKSYYYVITSKITLVANS